MLNSLDAARPATGQEKHVAEISDLERLVATNEIKNLMARRVRSLDTKDWDTYRDCHAPEHVSHVLAAGRDAMMAALLKSLDGVSTIHHVHSPEIRILSSTEATGWWALEDWLHWMQGDEEHWLHGWGYYHDSYAKRDGEWLFTSRRLERLRLVHSPGSNRAHERPPAPHQDNMRVAKE